MNKQRDDLAKEFANSLRNITEYKCPRDIVNPGLWFGFQIGWDLALKSSQKKKMLCDDAIIHHEYSNLRPSNSTSS